MLTPYSSRLVCVIGYETGNAWTAMQKPFKVCRLTLKQVPFTSKICSLVVGLKRLMTGTTSVNVDHEEKKSSVTSTGGISCPMVYKPIHFRGGEGLEDTTHA